MKIVGRLFVAFCVASVLAQLVIVAMSYARGNINSRTLTQGMALINGIDINGDRLQNMLDRSKEMPTPTYDETVEARAKASRNLQMREDSIRREKALIEQKTIQLKEDQESFDRRITEFYNAIDSKEQELMDESMLKVKKIIETMQPGLAKEQLKQLLEEGRETDVVAIVKDMPSDKLKKILGEFTSPEETEQLSDILIQILEGEPQAGVIRDARSSADPTGD